MVPHPLRHNSRPVLKAAGGSQVFFGGMRFYIGETKNMFKLQRGLCDLKPISSEMSASHKNHDQKYCLGEKILISAYGYSERHGSTQKCTGYQGVRNNPPIINAPCPNSEDLVKNRCPRKFWPNLAKNKSTPKKVKFGEKRCQNNMDLQCK